MSYEEMQNSFLAAIEAIGEETFLLKGAMTVAAMNGDLEDYLVRIVQSPDVRRKIRYVLNNFRVSLAPARWPTVESVKETVTAG